MTTTNEAAIIEAVTLGLLATGEWQKPSHENGLMKLKTVRGGIELRVDMTPNQSNIFALEYGLTENEWVFTTADDILGGVARMLKDVREAMAV